MRDSFCVLTLASYSCSCVGAGWVHHYSISPLCRYSVQWSKDQVYDGDAGLNLVAAEAIDAATWRYSFLIEGLEEGVPQFVRMLASNRVGYSAPQRAVPLGTNLEVQAIVLKESNAALIEQVK